MQTLEEYIRIENQSPFYDPEWASNGLQEQAAELLVAWVKRQDVKGLTIEIIKEEGRTPLIFAEVEGAVDGADASNPVLLYGHFDKQPPLTDTWDADLHPYTPVTKDGKLYGRGGADDGYSIFAAVTAIAALQKQNAAYPRCVIVIEGSEESGSPDLPFYIDRLAAKIGTPRLVICLDSGCGNYDQFWLTSSLRGLVCGILKVEILKEGVHSGKASGLVPSTFRILRKIMSRVEDVDSGEVTLKALHVDIPEHRVEQAKKAGSVLGDLVVEEFPFLEGCKPVDLPTTELLLNKSWRPALSTTGVDGIPPLERAGNVLRPHTSVMISMRIPPRLEPKDAAAALKEALEKDPPYGAKVTFEVNKAGPGWDSPVLVDWLDEEVQNAGKAFFGKEALFIGEGGSIPFMGMLGAKFPKAQFVVTGLLGPNSNAHGPNEFMHIGMSKKVTACVAYLLNAQTKHM